MARLGDARSHASLKRVSPCGEGGFFHIEMTLRRDRGAIYENLASGVSQQVIGPAAIETKNGPHCSVIGHNRDNDIAEIGDLRKSIALGCADIRSQFACRLRAGVIDGANDVALIFQTEGHVRAHPPDADKSNGVHKGGVI